MNVPLKPDHLSKYRNLTRSTEVEAINLHPIQSGGRAGNYPEVVKAVLNFIDGYSTCDYCIKGRLDEIESPPLRDFHADLAEFIEMDEVRLLPGCRQAQFAAFHSLASPGDYIIIDSLAHYSTYLAAERVGLKVVEVPNSGFPYFEVSPEFYAEKIEEVKRTMGKPPALVFLTHVDYSYGNLADAEAVAKISHEYDVPFVLNCAYTIGRMPVSGRKLGADVVTASLHKSFASPAPSGILAANEEYAEQIFRRSMIRGEWSGREFPNKEVELLGCTLPGCVVVGVMAAFPYVVERVERWSEEVEKARYFSSQLTRIEGVIQLGQNPHNHDLLHFESQSFFNVAQNHPRKGFFLYDELKARGVVGVQPGLSKSWKLSTYGQSWENVKVAAQAFLEIAEKYGIPVS
ncbi:MAG: O-phospho-L-seryl-tRNA:Cys-tRNA synthase [Candidatus Freyarchaeota archaeon]|nr:O-phospho-L-seryl-tRNA:Cys-tRNA synthase [Candidatus Jordarchaeia archaeon]